MIDPSKTSLYNHAAVGDGTKPLIPNIVYKRLLESIDNGITDELNKVVSEYALTEDQEILIEYKLNEQKNKGLHSKPIH
jgi:hypothetical protein